jgi:hypothetical protein
MRELQPLNRRNLGHTFNGIRGDFYGSEPHSDAYVSLLLQFPNNTIEA